MKEKEKIKVKGNGNVSMSLYEINQSIVHQLPAYDQIQINILRDKINNWKKEFPSAKYFMLMCKDRSSYTMLEEASDTIANYISFGHAVIELLLSFGTIQTDEIADEKCEIWVKEDMGTFVYLLFPYDQGVITYGT